MKSATTSEKPPRERILDTASELFYQKGIQNVGIDEVIARAGVAKMSLYKHFESKDLLIAEVLRQRNQQWQSWFKATVEGYGTTPTEQLLAIFDALKEWFESRDFRGCAFMNAAVELANPEHPGYQVVLENKQSVYQYILKLVQAVDVLDPESLARQIVLLAEGAIAVALVQHNSASARQAKTAASVLLSTQLGICPTQPCT